MTLIALVVQNSGLGGLFIGDHITAFEAAADLSRQRHIVWIDRPYQRVLSWAQSRYDELWTGAKAMYKLEPDVTDGGELIIYAPHLDTVSHVHGRYIYEAGYHVMDYFLRQWDRFRHIPTGVLAHSTHVKGIGTFENNIETPRIRVALASRIPPGDCATLNLGYYDPGSIDLEAWKNGPEDWLFVPKAGETLYRVRD
jgi:nickel-dependent lactate racemase